MSAALPVATSRREALRWVLAPPIALALVWLLVLLMEWMIRAPEIEQQAQPEADSVQMVRVEPPKEPPPEATAKLPDLAPPPPPAAPPSMARPALPAIAAPAIAIAPATVDVAVTGTPVDLGGSLGLSASGAFGGFAGSGSGNGTGGGNGSGGGGFARGEGFSGKELIPLSTARPQMPAWACKQKIKGWVEVVFTVTAGGAVDNVRIIDAQPRGVYEAAAIESVSHWIYPRSKQAQEVKQRVPMDPEDCAFNYGQ